MVAAACSFIIALSLAVKQSTQPMMRANQPVQQAMTERDSLPQTSPLMPIYQIASAPIIAGITGHSLQGAPAHLNSGMQQESATVTPPVKMDRESPIDVTEEEMPVENQPAETYLIPTEFQAQVVKSVTPRAKEKVIALTFDDGPWPRTTLQVLKILDNNNIKATFFWIGQNVKAYPQIAREVVANGHAIGNHTWHHSYRSMDEPMAAHEIEDTTKLIYMTTGVKTSVFRPPGGLLNNGVADYAKKKNYVMVMWSVDSMDYNRLTPKQLVNNVLRKAQPGGIVLMHDGGGDRPATVEALPQIIAQLKEQGYSFVTVPELLTMKDTEQSEVMAKKQLDDSPLSPTIKP